MSKNLNQLSADLKLTARDVSVLCIVARYQEKFREEGIDSRFLDITPNALLVAHAILSDSKQFGGSSDITAAAKYYREWNEQCELYHKN